MPKLRAPKINKQCPHCSRIVPTFYLKMKFCLKRKKNFQGLMNLPLVSNSKHWWIVSNGCKISWYPPINECLSCNGLEVWAISSQCLRNKAPKQPLHLITSSRNKIFIQLCLHIMYPIYNIHFSSFPHLFALFHTKIFASFLTMLRQSDTDTNFSVRVKSEKSRNAF